MKSTLSKPIKRLMHAHIDQPKGFIAGGVHAGLRKTKLDFGWVFSEVPANAAGVFTQNTFQAAPLHVTKEALNQSSKLQSIIVNAANANSYTGEQGLSDAYKMQQLAAQKLGVTHDLVAVASTGVIGEMLPMDLIAAGIDRIGENKNAEAFEQAILTTDTKTKHIAVEVEIDGKTITIAGAAKGSGMIHPNMATMLSFITTDAKVDANSLQAGLRKITDQTFNRITVDGDCSTNDMVLILANGMQNNQTLNENHPEWDRFIEAWNIVSRELAKMIARDGEGATKLISVTVEGTKTENDAAKIAKSVISSNLVKTAIYGEDANWGRILCAIGYSDVPFDENGLSIAIGSEMIIADGMPIPFNEKKCVDEMAKDTVQLFVGLKEGIAKATAWGCDLTYDYVKINASYRT
ncbi:bifunctional ornithine acetyltransferase/N-acetylglutamate synthase [Oceanobacillus sp. J11TS1]|uniref:bifunctional ornithine acetyltransferase/N-acetylglutamate synthase n=1 Tax=Oceanobacillus sp. J11TS1 TaxID=2807191 RepID=UPI001B127FD0|nr:bifunctional ornithine acetyltransferase/N-acetylglutamate synthase [Oceanobacillus sp. J11TS1]GIO21574.1 bifunctional glutamate N-acetyltransferase/amino-acid acetyltransferase ArgJ [Oceanobacillus sp. J11TS1]